MLTLITSRCCDDTTDKGPTGRSDSGDKDAFEFRMPPLKLDVLRVSFAVTAELSVSDCGWADFLTRAIFWVFQKDNSGDMEEFTCTRRVRLDHVFTFTRLISTVMDFPDCEDRTSSSS